MSGIYIKGMEMPTKCCDCKMYVEDIYCCHLLHREIENPWADDDVELDCPLVPVPEHGRLIDADALKHSGVRDCIYVYETGKVYVEIDDIVGAIDAAPTIIPADEEAEK